MLSNITHVLQHILRIVLEKVAKSKKAWVRNFRRRQSSYYLGTRIQ